MSLLFSSVWFNYSTALTGGRWSQQIEQIIPDLSRKYECCALGVGLSLLPRGEDDWKKALEDALLSPQVD